jgi:hypothetical protein
MVECYVRDFFPKGKPSFMREMYCNYVSIHKYCNLREDIVRERRGSYSGFVLGCIPSFVG